MAEGLLRSLAGDRFEVSSAGTHPVGLNPYAVHVMKEIGIDISTQRSKSVQEFLDQSFDYVITVCDQAKEACPVFYRAQGRLHWSFRDPAAVQGVDEVKTEAFRQIRDQIAEAIRRFIRQPSVLTKSST
jgi:arsenate reductase